jgi:hypothetical protein
MQPTNLTTVLLLAPSKATYLGGSLSLIPITFAKIIPCLLGLMLAFQSNGLTIGLNFNCRLMTLDNKFNGLVQSAHKEIDLIRLP